MIDPYGMELPEWADAVMSLTRVTSHVGYLTDPAEWQEWAVGFVRAPDIAQRVLPDPYQFSDWREWAMRAYPMLEGMG